MLRVNKKCEKCETIYDMMDYECSNCHNPNEDFYKTKTSDRTVNVSIPYQLVFFSVGFLGLNIISLAVQFIVLAVVGFDPEVATTEINNAITVIATYLLLLSVMLVFVILKRKKFIRAFTSWKPYVAGLIGGVALLGLSMAYSYLIQVIHPVGDNANQEAVVEVTHALPVLSFIVLAFVGPFCEELTYRVGLFSFLNRWSKIGAYLISMVVFALIHFDWSVVLSLATGTGANTELLVVELLNLPSYLIAGAGLAFLYDRFGFASSLVAHVLNNAISVIMILIG